MSSIETVFNCGDIMEHIMSFLPYYMVSGMAPVNKTCNMISKRVYSSKHAGELLQPFDDIYNKIIYTVNLFIDSPSGVKNIMCTNECCLLCTCKHNICNIVNVLNFYTDTILEKKLWVMLVKDFEKMEKYFDILSKIYIVYECYCTNIYLKDIIPLSIQSNIEKTRDKICNYMYIEYPNKYTVVELRKFAKFKRIKNFHKMRRSTLIRHLRRPVNESYYIEE